MASWHGLAKLRQHTDETLKLLDDATTALGVQIRRFTKEVCPDYDTRELPGDAAAEGRRKAKQARNRRTDKGKGRAQPSDESTSGPKRKEYNLKTFKLHALGHYVRDIRRYGTTDSYSTQTVSDACFNCLVIY